MDKTIEIILVASVLMITAIFASTMLTSSFSGTKSFVNGLYEKAESKDKETKETKGGDPVTTTEMKKTGVAEICSGSEPPGFCETGS